MRRDNVRGRHRRSIGVYDECATVCDKYGMKFHVDGARILNAAVKLGVQPSDLVVPCDTVSMCLSKGVGAPVGSVLVGSTEVMEEARRMRKLLGGGMRQVAFVLSCTCWPGHVRDQFSEDHKNANKLAELLNDIDGFNVDMGGTDELSICGHFETCVDISVLQNELGKARYTYRDDKYGGNHPSIQNIRFVTHRDISSHDVLDLF